jgi:prenyl protein peptidase
MMNDLSRLFGGNCEHHVDLKMTEAISYCLVLSGAFVGSLYVAPAWVRALPRDDARQIRWRTMATSVICIVSLATYSLIFCAASSKEGSFQVPPLFDLGRDVRAVLGTLTHTALLYLGPIIEMSLDLYNALTRDGAFSLKKYIISWRLAYIDPILRSVFKPSHESERWGRLRALVVAPLAEELVFRKCMLQALSSTGMGLGKVIFVAPLFFGIAHAHHALLSIQKGERPIRVLVQTAFQFTYTSLFGSYVSYVFLRTGSVLSVVISHSFCNAMGLPSLSFTDSRSPLFSSRTYLWSAHVAGVIFFTWGFQSSWLLPQSGLRV